MPVRQQGATVTLCHCVLDILGSRGGRGCSQCPPKYNVAAPWRRLRTRSATEREVASLKSLCDTEITQAFFTFKILQIFTVQQVTYDFIHSDP